MLRRGQGPVPVPAQPRGAGDTIRPGCSSTSASSHKTPGFFVLQAVWGHNTGGVLGPGTWPDPRDPKRHHGPRAPRAGENQTLPKARQRCVLGGEGLEALPKALHQHGDEESFKSTLRSRSALNFLCLALHPFQTKTKELQKRRHNPAEQLLHAEQRLRQSWGCPQPRGTKPRWQQHVQGHLS